MQQPSGTSTISHFDLAGCRASPPWVQVTSGRQTASNGAPLAAERRSRESMQKLYFVLAALHIVSMVVTGALWTIIDLSPTSRLRKHLRDIRAVHFGSLYLVPWFLGLSWAFT